MAKLELPGKFWLPGSPARVPGILHVRKSDCHVQLLGAFEEVPFAKFEASRYPIVFGELHASAPKPASGASVTLLDAFSSSLSWDFGGSKLETVACNQAFVGDEHLPSAEDVFVAAECAVHGLPEWVNHPAFNIEWTEGTSIPKVEPVSGAPEIVELGDFSVEIRTRASVKMNHVASRVGYSRSTDVIFRPSKPMSISDFSRRCLVPLRNLVTLAWGEDCAIQRASYVLREIKGHPWPPSVHDLLPHRKRIGSKLKRSSMRDPFFVFPGAEPALSSMMKAWFEHSVKHRRVFGLVFGLIEARPYFAEMRFRLTLEALDLVARNIGRCAPADLAERMPTFVASLVEDRARFFAEVASVSSRLWENEAPFGMRLYYLTEVLMWIVRATLATVIGVSEGELANSAVFAKQARHIRARLSA